MGALCKLIWWAVAGLFRSRTSLEAENPVLRHQLNVLRRKSPARIAFSSVDRMVFAGLYALAPNVLDALNIVKPDTVIRWHRAGFRPIRPASVRRRRSGRMAGNGVSMRRRFVEALTTTCREFSAFTANVGVHHVNYLCSRLPYYRLEQTLRDYPDFCPLWTKLKSEFCPALECAV